MLKSFSKKWAVYGEGYVHVLRRSPEVRNGELLVVHLDHLGDVCTLIPVVYPLAKSTRVTVVCKSGLEEIWKTFLPMVTVVPIGETLWSASAMRRQHPWLQTKAFEFVVVVTIAPFSAFFSSLAVAGRRVGLTEGGRYYKGSRLLFHEIYNAGSDEHVWVRFPGLFEKATGQKIVPHNPPYVSDAPDQITLLIHPGGKWVPRRWPVERYVSVAKRVFEQFGVRCEFLIHETETDLKHYVKQHVGSGGLILRETKNVRELIQVVSSCTVFLGNDSGPVHLANLMGRQTIVVWGPGNYERIQPLGENNEVIIREIDCRPCRQYQDDSRCMRGANECMIRISVDEVFEAVSRKIRTLGETT